VAYGDYNGTKTVARLVGACPTHRISVIALGIETTNITLSHDQTHQWPGTQQHLIGTILGNYTFNLHTLEKCLQFSSSEAIYKAA